MPPRAAADAAPAAPAAGDAAPARGGLFGGSMLRTAAIFVGLQVALPRVIKYMGWVPNPDVSSAGNVGAPLVQSGAASGSVPSQPLASVAPKAIQASPLWPMGSQFSVIVFLSTSDDSSVGTGRSNLPSHEWTGLTLGDWSWSRVWETEFETPAVVQRNGSLHADFFLVRDGARLNADRSDPEKVVHVRKLLTRYMPERRVRAERNLLSKMEESIQPVEEKPLEIISYWYPNLTMIALSEASIIPYSQLQPVMQDQVQLTDHVPDEAGRRRYLPILSPNDFWNLHSNYNPINETITRLPLRIELQPVSMLKWQLFTTMTDAFDKQAQTGGGGSELDEIKRALIETSPWLLITTAVVSVLHMVFEFLAFAGDISHVRKRKNNIGVSVRTILTNVFMQTVILLYLLDNREGTSYMIVLTQGMGIAIEAWKITKAVNIRVHHDRGLIPRVTFEDKHIMSEDEKKTQEYDALAFRLVGYVMGPILVGYTMYSLYYSTHRSWYSFVISTLTSFVYGAGFATLIPQLIINYKLKSVAHIPMKAMMYKTFATVIDDFFSFVIRMPLLHRLACFRDDIVFLILLYQKWIYRTDMSRQNEFGQMGTDHVDAAQPEKTDENAATRALENRKDR